MTRHFGRRFVPQSTIDRRVQAKDDRINRATQRRAAKAAALKVAADHLRPVPVNPDVDELQRDTDDRDEHGGETCSSRCGYCGRCS